MCCQCCPVEDGGDEVVDEDQQAESALEDTGEFGLDKPKSLPAPYTPSRQERMEHDLTHVPYRSWCPHCVRGKALALGHYARKPMDEEEMRVPLVALDYAFLKKTGVDESGTPEIGEVTTMVVKDRRSKCTFPIPVPQKGIDPEEYSVRQLLRVLEYLGYNELTLKCDQESALTKVIENAKVHRGANTQTMMEHSAVGDSQGNGLIERANRSVEGQVRTMISALEEKIGSKVSGTDSILPWLILHAGTILNRFTMGKDGKTPHERLRGRRSKRQLIEFGEAVHFLPLDIKDHPNVDARFQDGIWLGVQLGTEEHVIGTPTGIFKARSIRRKPADSRWDKEQIASIMGTPWKPYNFTESDKLRIALPKIAEPSEPTERVTIDDPVPKKVRIERRDLEKLGYTPSCPGCYAAKNNRPHRAHTDYCRSRVERAMTEDPMLRRKLKRLQKGKTDGLMRSMRRRTSQLLRTR